MKKEKIKILIIDDDPKISWILSEGLSANYDFVSARDGAEGIQMVSTEKPDLILLDIKMPGMTGLEVLEKLNKAPNRPDVIMLSGHGETKNIVESMQLGASEFLNKPFDVKEVEIHIQSVIEKGKLRQELKHLKSELKSRSQYEQFIGDSPKMMQVHSIIEQVADSELTVLIRGESGTGKEIVARLLHNLSGRAEEPFTKVNCAAIPRDLLEAELFGYEKGAFTGAHKTKPGRFEVANKGSIFLDEIGDMPLELQSKLLQVLEQQEFVRVGGIHNIHVDVRIICATNKNLEDAIRRQLFRDDLFYRLNEITILLPPLRQRQEDIPLLVTHFLQRYNSLYQRDYPALSPETMSRLLEFSWPGNVRQLENLIKQVVVRGDESIVTELIASSEGVAEYRYLPENGDIAAKPLPLETDGNAFSLKRRIGTAIAQEEKKLIGEVLNKTNWNRRKAADILEISYRSLLYKIKEYNLNTVK
jgi:two-component system, NtrC family, response regulator AtoC